MTRHRPQETVSIRRRRKRRFRPAVLAIAAFVALALAASGYGLLINHNIERIWQGHLEWLSQQQKGK